MIRSASFCGSLIVVWLITLTALSQGQGDNPEAEPTARDLDLLQGKWELRNGNEEKGAPAIRREKEIVGNRQTLRLFEIATDKKIYEESFDFTLTATGSVRVFTFYGIGGNSKHGGSSVYKVQANDFYDIPGLLQGDKFRNYQDAQAVWHWRRVKEEKADSVSQKLKTKIGVEFKRTPLQEALAFIGEEIGVTITINGDALKAGGFTKNMPQSLSDEDVTAQSAIAQILSKYQDPRKPAQRMVIVVDETNKKIVLTTEAVAVQENLTPFDLLKE